jgi:hypothetical protein
MDVFFHIAPLQHSVIREKSATASFYKDAVVCEKKQGTAEE